MCIRDRVFTVTPEGIRFGLLAIKNMGRSVIEDILKAVSYTHLDVYKRQP